MTADIEAQLERNRKLEDRIGIVASSFFITVLACFAWAHWSAYTAGQSFEWMLVQGGLVLLLASLVGLPALKWGLTRITSCFAPSFIIDESAPDVVKLYGAIRLDGTDQAEQKLLSTRPGLMLYRGNAYQDFGCTLAAVPATKEFLEARAELLKHGVSIL